MKKSILLSVVAVLALAGCVSHDFGEGKRTNYSCDGDKEFSSREVADSVEVYVAGQTHRLMPASDGVYSNGDIVLTRNDGRSSLAGVYGGPYENCRARAAQSWLPNLW